MAKRDSAGVAETALPGDAEAVSREFPADEVRTHVAHVLLVTGMSGAGRSSALRALEDVGYEVVDNLPLSLLGSLVRGGGSIDSPLAVGVDIRTRDFGAASFIDTFDALIGDVNLDVGLLFLDCDDEVLQRRYSATRRRHPLADDRPVPDGIRLERRRLARLRERANPVIDTTVLTEGDLRRVITDLFSPDRAPGMAVAVTSFAFGRGLPREADLVIDVRFLRNPHYEEPLRPLTGEDPAVGAYIAADTDFAPFFERLCAWLEPLLPRYRLEGKSYLTIAVGCTGGRHRSVYTAARLAEWIGGLDYDVRLRHRDVSSGPP